MESQLLSCNGWPRWREEGRSKRVKLDRLDQPENGTKKTLNTKISSRPPKLVKFSLASSTASFATGSSSFSPSFSSNDASFFSSSSSFASNSYSSFFSSFSSSVNNSDDGILFDDPEGFRWRTGGSIDGVQPGEQRSSRGPELRRQEDNCWRPSVGEQKADSPASSLTTATSPASLFQEDYAGSGIVPELDDREQTFILSPCSSPSSISDAPAVLPAASSSLLVPLAQTETTNPIRRQQQWEEQARAKSSVSSRISGKQPPPPRLQNQQSINSEFLGSLCKRILPSNLTLVSLKPFTPSPAVLSQISVHHTDPTTSSIPSPDGTNVTAGRNGASVIYSPFSPVCRAGVEGPLVGGLSYRTTGGSRRGRGRPRRQSLPGSPSLRLNDTSLEFRSLGGGLTPKRPLADLRRPPSFVLHQSKHNFPSSASSSSDNITPNSGGDMYTTSNAIISSTNSSPQQQLKDFTIKDFISTAKTTDHHPINPSRGIVPYPHAKPTLTAPKERPVSTEMGVSPALDADTGGFFGSLGQHTTDAAMSTTSRPIKHSEIRALLKRYKLSHASSKLGSVVSSNTVAATTSSKRSSGSKRKGGGTKPPKAATMKSSTSSPKKIRRPSHTLAKKRPPSSSGGSPRQLSRSSFSTSTSSSTTTSTTNTLTSSPASTSYAPTTDSTITTVNNTTTTTLISAVSTDFSKRNYSGSAVVRTRSRHNLEGGATSGTGDSAGPVTRTAPSTGLLQFPVAITVSWPTKPATDPLVYNVPAFEKEREQVHQCLV